MFSIFSLKKSIIHFRISIKYIILFAVAILLITGAILFFYKPTYMVSYNGEFLGYVTSKSMLQSRINEFIKVGNGTNNVAFVQIEKKPEYKLCLLKREMQTNDTEIYDKIVDTGIYYYKYYTILLDGVEKYNLATYDEAQSVITKLKEKDSNNIAKITVGEKYNTELAEFASVDTCVENLYEKKVIIQPKPAATRTAGSGSIGSSSNVNRGSGGASLGGLTLIRPVNGMISCRYGQQRGYYHTGLDIATSNGTPIAAAAAGTVSYAAYHYSYGNLLIVNHANGVQTYYAHCSKLYVSVGQSVSQGQTIAAVGSTGNSTGPHLHLEVRVNGTAQNPQNYVY